MYKSSTLQNVLEVMDETVCNKYFKCMEMQREQVTKFSVIKRLSYPHIAIINNIIIKIWICYSVCLPVTNSLCFMCFVLKTLIMRETH